MILPFNFLYLKQLAAMLDIQKNLSAVNALRYYLNLNRGAVNTLL